MTAEQTIAQRLVTALSDPRHQSAEGLNGALHLLAMWRARLIGRAIVQREGLVVRAGPFQGMTYLADASEAGVSSRLLGCYEGELHAEIEQIIGCAYDHIIDVGCSDGYYAIGFARRMPETIVHAYDVNPAAQDSCRRLAAVNGVSERVRVGGAFEGRDFERFTAGRTLVFMDAEGAEDDLLRPDLHPNLARLSVLVECHDLLQPGLSGRIAARFAPTHDVTRIGAHLTGPDLPEWLSQVSNLDRLLATWEWRTGPTPWLHMVAKTA